MAEADHEARYRRYISCLNNRLLAELGAFVHEEFLQRQADDSSRLPGLDRRGHRRDP
jgi:hypothetical protein